MDCLENGVSNVKQKIVWTPFMNYDCISIKGNLIKVPYTEDFENTSGLQESIILVMVLESTIFVIQT